MTRLLAALCTVALAAGACSSSDPSSPTAAPQTTATVVTTFTTTMSTAAVFDVVALGGSNVAGYGLEEPFDPDNAYPAIYARSLAEEAGVETRYRAHHTLETTPWQNRSLSTWNQLLATDEEIHADLESADVVIIEIGVHTVILKCGTHLTFTKECLIDVTATMPAEYERLFRTVDELVDDGTIVIALNQGLARPTSEYWRDHPDWPAMKSEAFEVWWGGLDTAAAAHNVIVIDTAHMSGDPNEFGLGPEYTQLDGAHLNPEGHHLFADLLLEADGIEPVA
jgi:lysophospholipase L1-like esterase